METREPYSPILESLLEYQKKGPARFHVPGHKGGSFSSGAYHTYFHSILSLDVTELTGLDDLHHPQEAIAEAQRLAAACFHAEQTYFLVNGSTVGNLAMLMAALRRGDQILVQRNCHKSVFHALALIEAEAILIEPVMCPEFHVPIGLDIEQVQQALELYPQAKALILTTPNYYGMISSSLEEIIQKAQQDGCIVLIDEAHGAHFGQHTTLPRSAMQLGADASVQSTHKMLHSMTMTSMLHVQGKRLDREDVEYYLRSLQSSSPSYPLLASLDLARAQLEQWTPQAWEEQIEQTLHLRQAICQLAEYTVSDVQLEQGHYTSDPFKLTIQPCWGLSGYELQEELEQRGVYVELADPFNVLLTLPLIIEPRWNERLIRSLIEISQTRKLGGKRTLAELLQLTRNRSAAESKIKSLQMRKYNRQEVEEVPLEQAEGRRAAEMILPYPPGIPLCLPNEIVTSELVLQIRDLQSRGAYFQGKSDDFKSLLVVKE